MAVAGNGAPVVQRGRRIAVLVHGKAVWRSRGPFKANAVFALAGPGVVAVTYFGPFTRHGQLTSLYLAPFGGGEHRVSRGEYALGWTAHGDLLTWGHDGIRLRSASGRLLRRVLGRSRGFEFDRRTRTLLAITDRDALERYRSGRWSRLANLTALHLGPGTTLERPAGGLIGLVGARQVTVLRADGSLFASARFHSGDVAGASGLVANRAGTAVAFVVTRGPRQTVELLQAGERRPILLHSDRVPLGCGAWTTLAWHDHWLIDSTARGKTFLLDATRRARPVDITRLVQRLVPGGNPRSIAWA